MATYTPLQSITVTTAVSSVTFNNIDQTYTDLILVSYAASNNASDLDGYQFTLNGDSTSGLYSYTRLTGTGGAPAGDKSTSQNNIIAGAVSGRTTVFSPSTLQFPNYSNTTTNKTIIGRGGDPVIASGQISLFAGLWRNTAAITSITLLPQGASTWATGSTFSLYGILGGGTAKAAGGDIVISDGTYWYHAFTKSGTFTPAINGLSCDILAVAGGGGGGYNAAGGGGAGGLLYATSQALPSTLLRVLVGAGGVGAVNNGSAGVQNGANGSNSTVGSLVTAYGGGGGGASPYSGANGGSGGGGGAGTYLTNSSNYPGGTAVSGQGNAGGNGASSSAGYLAGGGGGGAGGSGGAGTATGISDTGGNGGVGVNTYSSWLSTTGTSFASGYLAGGGGGGGANTARGSGGSGGGGQGAYGGLNVASAGTANTGGGGGGGGQTTSGNSGMAGGSGLVIVRYAV